MLFDTFEDLKAACANVGVDLTCGTCASVFYTGGADGHPHTCERSQLPPLEITYPDPARELGEKLGLVSDIRELGEKFGLVSDIRELVDCTVRELGEKFGVVSGTVGDAGIAFIIASGDDAEALSKYIRRRKG